jgi:hypothetical protein
VTDPAPVDPSRAGVAIAAGGRAEQEVFVATVPEVQAVEYRGRAARPAGRLLVRLRATVGASEVHGCADVALGGRAEVAALIDGAGRTLVGHRLHLTSAEAAVAGVRELSAAVDGDHPDTVPSVRAGLELAALATSPTGDVRELWARVGARLVLIPPGSMTVEWAASARAALAGRGRPDGTSEVGLGVTLDLADLLPGLRSFHSTAPAAPSRVALPGNRFSLRFTRSIRKWSIDGDLLQRECLAHGLRTERVGRAPTTTVRVRRRRDRRRPHPGRGGLQRSRVTDSRPAVVPPEVASGSAPAGGRDLSMAGDARPGRRGERRR